MCRVDPAIASLDFTAEECREDCFRHTRLEKGMDLQHCPVGKKKNEQATPVDSNLRVFLCVSLAMDSLRPARNRFSGRVILDWGRGRCRVYARGAKEATRQLTSDFPNMG